MTRPSTAFAGIEYRTTTRSTNPRNTDVSTRDTIEVMKALALRDKDSPIIHQAVNDATSKLNGLADDRTIVRAIFYYVKSKVKFIEDEWLMHDALHIALHNLDQELLIAPSMLLSMRTPMGDCDDYSTLIAAMLCNLNFKCWYVTIAADGDNPDKYSHVYVKTYLEDEGVTQYLDASHGLLPGWEHDEIFRKTEWSIN